MFPQYTWCPSYCKQVELITSSTFRRLHTPSSYKPVSPQSSPISIYICTHVVTQKISCKSQFPASFNRPEQMERLFCVHIAYIYIIGHSPDLGSLRSLMEMCQFSLYSPKNICVCFVYICLCVCSHAFTSVSINFGVKPYVDWAALEENYPIRTFQDSLYCWAVFFSVVFVGDVADGQECVSLQWSSSGLH